MMEFPDFNRTRLVPIGCPSILEAVRFGEVQ